MFNGVLLISWGPGAEGRKPFLKRGVLKAFATLVLLGGSLASSAQGRFLEQKAEGWHWYEDRRPLGPVPEIDKKQKDQKSSPEESPFSAPQEASAARDILTALQQELEERRIQAVIFPTYHNVQAYQEIQKQMMDRAALFSKRWVEVVMTSPHLDYTLKRPLTQVGAQVYDNQKKEALEKKIQTLSKNYGLFFFYSTRCPYCQTFAPVVKRFSEKYGWPVLAISLDGGSLEGFSSQPDNGAAAKLGVTSLPTLLAVNPQTGTVLPLSYGYNALDGLEKRLQVFWEQGRVH